jgi:hypothetical protein
MKRATVIIIAFAAALTAACGGDAGSASPTGPTPTNDAPPSTSTNPPPASNPATLAAPANLSATVDGSRVNLTWNGVSGANDYMVHIGTQPGTGNIISTNTSKTDFQWNGGPKGTYYARVVARNSQTSSGSSNEITITISAS